MTDIENAPRCPFAGHSVGLVDLVDPALYASGDPHDAWRRMRAHAPVSWQDVPGRGGFWSVTKYADADEVLRDHTRFTSERGTLLTLLGTDDPAGGRQMAATDPPRHSAMRGPLQRALTIKSVERNREKIRATVVRTLEPFADGGVHDFAVAMAALPMAVTGTLMALPKADWARLTVLTTAAVAPDDPDFDLGGNPAATLSVAHRELFAYFQDVVRDRRNRPDDDLISVLLRMTADGRRLSLSEIVSNCYSLLLGANVTTPHVPAAMVARIGGTEVWERWAAHPALNGSGTGEALRWASPANHFMRYATVDCELRGQRIPAGDAVVVWLGSANRDEDVFDDPYQFDVRRRPNKHLAFGVGPHYCIGHTIARVTLRVLFAEMLSRFAAIAPAGGPARLCSNFVAGFKRMPVAVRLRGVPGPVAY